MEKKRTIIDNAIRGFAIFCLAYLCYKFIAILTNYNYGNNNHSAKIYRQTDTVNIEDLLENTADSLNRTPSMYSDSTTIFENATVLPNKTFQYNYALKIDTRKYNIPKMKELTEKNLLDKITTIPSFKLFKDSSVTVVFNFTDIKMKPLYKIVFTPDKFK